MQARAAILLAVENRTDLARVPPKMRGDEPVFAVFFALATKSFRPILRAHRRCSVNGMTKSSQGAVSGETPDFAALFEKTPGLYLILDPSFDIVAANDAYCAATMTVREEILGHHLFQVFPDNPGDSAADGVQNLRASLLKVLKSCQPDHIPMQKYDIERRGIGGFEVRYWSAHNIPVLGADGYVKWIIHNVEDVTTRRETQAKMSGR